MSAQAAEQALKQFDKAWRAGAAPRIEDFLQAAGKAVNEADRKELWEELVAVDLEHRWRGGATAWLLEEYGRRYGQCAPAQQPSVELVAWEYWLRQRWGDRPSHAEYAARFPHLGGDLPRRLAEIDAELASEFDPKARNAARANHHAEPPAATARPGPAGGTPPGTVAALLATLRQTQLLSSTQSDTIHADQRRFADPRALAGNLLKLGWLTPYQANQLLQGRGQDLVVGPYLLLERLGEGGAGQVFKARHQKLNRIAALKLIHRELLADAEVVGRFYREIEVVSRLDHPNVVHAYDAGPVASGPATPATHFLAMEYIEGTDLAKLVKQGGPLPVMQACEYIRQAALGLQHAHEKGLVHRDVKPHNLIMALREGLIKVADLGLARLPRAGNEEVTAALTNGKSGSSLTPVGAVLMGTADYLAPEQALDFHATDIRADIYSLGCTLYYLLAGQPPFKASTLAEKLVKHQQVEPPALQEFRPDVPAELGRIVRKMLAKRPQDRYQTPAEVALALAPLAGKSSGARRRLLPAKRALALGGGVLVLGLALFVLWRPLSRIGTGTFREGPFVPTQVGRLDLPPQHLLHVVAFGPEGRLAASSGDGTVRDIVVWDTASGKEKFRLSGHKEPVSYLAFSPDGPFLASGSVNEKTWKLWDLNTRQPLYSDKVDELFLLGPFSANGALLAVTARWPGGTNKVTTWDRFTKRYTDICQGVPSTLAFDLDHRLALGGGGAEVLDLVTGKKSQYWSGGNGVAALAFSPDQTRLAVGAYKTVLVHWLDPTGHKEPYVMWKAHEDGVMSLAYAPDGKTLATGGVDALIKLWDPATGNEVAVLKGHSKPVNRLTFSSDGKQLFSAGADDTIRVWQVRGGAPEQVSTRALH
jgi:eukaryotic-like serine/threonine-protein kinase